MPLVGGGGDAEGEEGVSAGDVGVGVDVSWVVVVVWMVVGMGTCGDWSGI